MSVEQIKTTSQVFVGKEDEKILVVSRDQLFGERSFQGFQSSGLDEYQDIIARQHQFIWRSTAETDPTYKQIIPYLVFRYHNRYFLMQRAGKASEARLQNKFSLGIGGHIRQEDIEGASIANWARREFHEEVSYQGEVTITPLGLLNDDSNDVGKVHLGFVYLLEGESPDISVSSELKSGALHTLEECGRYYDHMETWSQLVFDYLRAR